MLAFIFAVFLALIMLLAISLDKTYQHTTAKEMKRQARRGNALAQLLYKPIRYGMSLHVLLWLVVVLSAAGSFVLFSTTVPSIIAFLLIIILIGMGFWWLPEAADGTIAGRIALWCAPLLSRLLYYLHPLLSAIGRLIRSHYPLSVHAGLYEKEDLIELLERQKSSPDNRIPVGELDVAEHALSFGDKIVRDSIVPRRVVRTVSLDASIGPIFIDELHQTGHSRFPVFDGKPDNIVGTLYLRDLINLKQHETVAQAMRQEVFYVHEDFSLYQALQAFLRTKHHLFIVVNSFEEFVGIITIEDVLEQVLGKPIVDEFDRYEDIRAVATALAVKEHTEHEKADSEPTEVVE